MPLCVILAGGFCNSSISSSASLKLSVLSPPGPTDPLRPPFVVLRPIELVIMLELMVTELNMRFLPL